MSEALPTYDTLTDEQLANMLAADMRPTRRQTIGTLTSKARLRNMPAADIATERESLRLFLRNLGGDVDNAPGWLVALYDQWAALLDQELGRRLRFGSLPRWGVKPTVRPDVVDEIRRNIDIVALMQAHGIDLQERGREWTGRCPFHDDRHPSMSVNPIKNVYHCHACGAGGDAFTFVMAHYRCEFTEAVKRLAAFVHAATVTHG